jgi:hypothetical protein
MTLIRHEPHPEDAATMAQLRETIAAAPRPQFGAAFRPQYDERIARAAPPQGVDYVAGEARGIRAGGGVRRPHKNGRNGGAVKKGEIVPQEVPLASQHIGGTSCRTSHELEKVEPEQANARVGSRPMAALRMIEQIGSLRIALLALDQLSRDHQQLFSMLTMMVDMRPFRAWLHVDDPRPDIADRGQVAPKTSGPDRDRLHPVDK